MISTQDVFEDARAACRILRKSSSHAFVPLGVPVEKSKSWREVGWRREDVNATSCNDACTSMVLVNLLITAGSLNCIGLNMPSIFHTK